MKYNSCVKSKGLWFVWLALVPCLLSAEIVQKGALAGRSLLPIGKAEVAVAESPLAAVMVLKHAAPNYEQLARFDAAMQTTATAGIPAFAIVELENEDQLDVVEEIVQQRGVRMPVFGTTDEILGDENAKLYILAESRATPIEGMDLNKLSSELALLRPPQKEVSSPDISTSAPVILPAKNPLYVNQRYEFSVRWPQGWNYRVARNNDGAVGVAPAGSELEARVWAAPEIKSSDPTDPPAYVQIKDYLDYLKTIARGEVRVESKLKVFDGDIEGRDYTYTYVRAGKDGKPDRKYRGRIQAFVVDGIAKLICAEGPEEEFRKEEETIDKFIYSFHPTID